MTKTASKKFLRLYTPEGFVNRLITDNEGNIKTAIRYFIDEMKGGRIINDADWCAAVLAKLYGELAAKQF